MSDYFAHESSHIDEGAEIGTGTKIWHFPHVIAGARVGERCSFGQNVSVAGATIIGNNVKVNRTDLNFISLSKLEISKA